MVSVSISTVMDIHREFIQVFPRELHAKHINVSEIYYGQIQTKPIMGNMYLLIMGIQNSLLYTGPAEPVRPVRL